MTEVDVTDEKLIDLYRVVGGWHAAGKGWAVFGKTPEEARAKFDEAVARHRQIMARGTTPFQHDRR